MHKKNHLSAWCYLEILLTFIVNVILYVKLPILSITTYMDTISRILRFLISNSLMSTRLTGLGAMMLSLNCHWEENSELSALGRGTLGPVPQGLRCELTVCRELLSHSVTHVQQFIKIHSLVKISCFVML